MDNFRPSIRSRLDQIEEHAVLCNICHLWYPVSTNIRHLKVSIGINACGLHANVIFCNKSERLINIHSIFATNFFSVGYQKHHYAQVCNVSCNATCKRYFQFPLSVCGFFPKDFCHIRMASFHTKFNALINKLFLLYLFKLSCIECNIKCNGITNTSDGEMHNNVMSRPGSSVDY